ncbi:MAG: hypothetical protein Q27BPR15_18235 [Rhodobacter sp. CACIA14H1]|nr:MAG: hypothetical protein Q27BPR15_18235 [Rhodobacter sp. CACIA14H1]
MGAMAIGGSVKIAMFTPRDRRSATGERTKTNPASTASTLPITKPAPDAARVAVTCAG